MSLKSCDESGNAVRTYDIDYALPDCRLPACETYLGDAALEVVDPATFHSIIGMAPYEYTDEMGKAGGYIEGARYWLFKELGK